MFSKRIIKLYSSHQIILIQFSAVIYGITIKLIDAHTSEVLLLFIIKLYQNLANVKNGNDIKSHVSSRHVIAFFYPHFAIKMSTVFKVGNHSINLWINFSKIRF